MTLPLRKEPPKPDPTNLGSLLLQMGAITPRDLDLALRAQAAEGGKLGAHLRARGATSPETVSRALELQVEFRDGDKGNAALELMERGLEALCAGEERCSAAIESAKQDRRDSGEPSAAWLRAPR